MSAPATSRFRLVLVMGLLGLAACALAARAAYLQIWQSAYLQKQGDARFLRVIKEASARGMILDRNGEPLAVSTPVESLWAQPELVLQAQAHWVPLAHALEIPASELATRIRRHKGREFMYLKRQVSPAEAARVLALKVPGVASMREYRRYYPAGAATAHVVGFTNVDDAGQEGMELVYNDWLAGVPGQKRVIKDRLGRIIESVESVSLPKRGKDLVLSIDRRLQYLAYRELKLAIEKHEARGGSIVMLDARTGEILAMVNSPGFNPNSRAYLRGRLFRNRAVTDVFEPGSTIKPFTVAAALASGKYSPNSLVNTAPGSMRVGEKMIHDARNFGWLSVTRVIEKSSNVGVTKIALDIGKAPLWQMLHNVGFGMPSGANLPSEASGRLAQPARWAHVDHATLSYGYGVSVTILQLARAYTVLATGGRLLTPTLIRRDNAVAGERVMRPEIAHAISAMLERAVGSEGTGQAADIPYYRVAGKTGTTHKLINGAYADDRYVAMFAGFAPASMPRIVMVIGIDDPIKNGHFGGQVAAPVFHRVMAGALRLLNVAPDERIEDKARVARAPGRAI